MHLEYVVSPHFIYPSGAKHWLSQHSTFSATSACTYKAINAYVRDGTLPKPGTICDIEEELFPGVNNTGQTQRRDESDEMAEVYRRFTKKMQAWYRSEMNGL
jgi:hypothetical protein